MKLETAIEILTSATKQFKIVGEGNFKEAIQLGIEALKAIQNNRRGLLIDNIGKLPGETKE
jgi:hypothetical protein